MAQSKIQQRTYRILIEDIVRRVRAHEFSNHKDLIAAYGRTLPSFASKAKRSAIRLNSISEVEWNASFPKRHRRTVKRVCPSCGHTWQPPKSKTVR